MLRNVIQNNIEIHVYQFRTLFRVTILQPREKELGQRQTTLSKYKEKCQPLMRGVKTLLTLSPPQKKKKSRITVCHIELCSH